MDADRNVYGIYFSGAKEAGNVARRQGLLFDRKSHEDVDGGD